MFRTIERRRRCSRFWDKPLPRRRRQHLDAASLPPLTPRRPPTATAASPATASAVASRHLATAASPHRSLSPPSSMSRHHVCYLAAEASKRCLAATRLILGRPLSTRRPEVR